MIETKVGPGQRVAQDDRRIAGWLGFVTLFAALAYGSNLAGEDTSIEEPLYDSSFFVASVVGLGMMVGVAFLVALGVRKRELFALRRPRSWPRATGYSFLILVGIFVLGALVSPFLDPGEEQGLLPEDWPPPDAAVFALNAAAVVIGAPLAEELFFRGLGYSLLERFGRWAAIVLVGIAFAIDHGLLQAFPALFVFGCALAWLRSRTDSVYPGVLLHSAFNGIALIAAVSI
jgi:membrane protease YdiL (CAAX protease family)